MKRFISYGFSLSVVLLFLACSSSTPVVVTPTQPVQTSSGGYGLPPNAPDWITKTPPLSAYATAEMGVNGRQFAIEEAKIDARAELAAQVSSKIQGLMKKFHASYGVGEDEKTDKMVSMVRRNIVDQAFPSRHAETFFADNGEVFVLVTLNLGAGEDIKSLLKNSVKSMNTSLGDREAAWQKFQADQGFKDLDKELDRLK